MQLHNLKIDYEYGMSVEDGSKTFEIRKNDRDYKEDDLIVFNCPGSESLTERFSEKIYRIEYITNYAQKEGWVVFSIKLLIII